MASSAWSNDLTTTLILPTGATPPDQRIVLDGASDTILVYNAAGALIASVAATAGNDGLGNNYPAGISATGGIVSQSIILLYNGTPALGNLVVSLANAAGSDTFGNNYAAGFNFYNGAATTYAQDLSGNITVGPIAGSNVKFKPGDGTHTFQVFDSSNRLVINVDSSNGILQTLDNTNLVANVINPGTITNLTAGGLAFSAMTSAGTQPTSTQLSNAGRVGPNGVGAGTNLLSPAPASTGRRSVVRASPVVGATNNPTVEILSTTGDGAADLYVYGGVSVFQDIFSYSADAPYTYTPSVTGGGTATFNSLRGWYWIIGRMCFFNAFFSINAAGSGAGNVQVTAPFSIDRTNRQNIPCHADGLTAGNNGSLTALCFTGGSGATIDRLRNSTNGTIQGADLQAGAIITIQGWFMRA